MIVYVDLQIAYEFLSFKCASNFVYWVPITMHLQNSTQLPFNNVNLTRVTNTNHHEVC